MKTKETLFFVVSAKDISTSSYDISDWNAYDELPVDAKEFIQVAMKNGRAYDVEEFMNQYNLEETISGNDWIFITNKY